MPWLALGADMRRREFIGLIGSVAAAWPFAVRAQQQSAMPAVGFIRTTSAAASTPLVAAFRKGLAEAGFVEGKDVAIELRFADDDFGRLPALASDLVRRGVAVIVGNNFAVPAIRAATTTIPVVFVGGDDPVRTGLVASLNKPGGNVTGITSLSYALTTKRLQLLHELVPAVLIDPHAAEFAPEEREAMKLRARLGATSWWYKLAPRLNSRPLSRRFPVRTRARCSWAAALFSPAASTGSLSRSLRGRL
jgi:ABC transporter substrate binding protein